MSTRTIVGAVGAIVGFIYGGPQGAQVGWMVGSAIGGLMDPEIIKGPSIGDIAAQTGQEGGPRPIVFALSQPMAGNIIASGEPVIVKKRESQGKGGPKVETESVYRTYAIGICEGPITRVARVWRNGKIVYDELTPDLEALTADVLATFLGNNQTFRQRARFFLGTYEQNASPDLEAKFGVGTTPAHRGTAYMVMADEDLTDMRGAIPQYMFQVERCEGTYLTSRPYPVEAEDALDLGFTPLDGINWMGPDDGMDMGFAVLDGTLADTLQTYEDAEDEAMDMGFAVLDGTFVEALQTYEDAEDEAMDMGFAVLDGTIVEALIGYSNWPDEAVDLGFEVLGGTLET